MQTKNVHGMARSIDVKECKILMIVGEHPSDITDYQAHGTVSLVLQLPNHDDDSGHVIDWPNAEIGNYIMLPELNVTQQSEVFAVL